MTDLQIRLFGPLTCTVQGKELSFPTRKAEAVFAYLVMQQRPIARESLTTMFWAQSKPKQAAANLRKLLSRLRTPLGDALRVHRQTITFAPQTPFHLDVAAFTAALSPPDFEGDAAPERLEAALALYRGDFLQDLHLPDSPEFNTWTIMQRERLQRLAATALQALVAAALRTRRYQAGIAHARHLLRLEPLREAVHRQLMLLLARSGRPEAALAHYAACRRMLAEKLGVDPTPETTTLANRIDTAVSHPPQLPIPDTPFIGRAAELRTLHAHLDDPQCRLLTLVGPSGVGKTRLALQAVAARRFDFLHGIYFVDLSGAETAVSLTARIANALHTPLTGRGTAAQQLLAYLQQKELLLLLDNCETILAPAHASEIDHLHEILQAAPQITFLATSQERFNFPEEYVLEITGLPDGSEDAVRLFHLRARQIRSDFAPGPEEEAAVAEVCRLVGGLPLGIELAAAATAKHRPTEIAAAIARDPDYLRRRQPDGPQRHASLRAAFNHSWHRLQPTEQRTMQRLACFRAGFTLETAVAVADAAPFTLLSLVDKSMLRLLPDGRYEMHRLLRQYATAQQSASETAQIGERHARHYLHHLAQQEAALMGDAVTSIRDHLQAVLDDLLAAWQWAMAHAPDLLETAVFPLSRFYLLTGPLQDAATLFGSTARQLSAHSPAPAGRLLATLYTAAARFWNQLGQHETAVVAARKALEHVPDFPPAAAQMGLARIGQGRYEEADAVLTQVRQNDAGTDWERAIAERGIGLIAFYRGQLEEAAARFTNAMQIYDTLGDQSSAGGLRNNLGVIHQNQGKSDVALSHYRQALPVFTTSGDQRGKSRILNNMGVVYRALGDYSQARRYFQQALQIKQEFGDRQGVALALNNLGNVAAALGDYLGAATSFHTALSGYRELGRQRDEAMVLSNLGLLAHLQDHRKKAVKYSREAVQIARTIGDRTTAAFALTHLGHALLAAGEAAAARTAYEEALEIRRDLNNRAWILETQAAILRTLPPGPEALALAEILLPNLSAAALHGSEEPLRIVYSCYRVLVNEGDPRALEVLAQAKEMLAAQAKRISDTADRESFLQNVAVHRIIQAA